MTLTHFCRFVYLHIFFGAILFTFVIIIFNGVAPINPLANRQINIIVVIIDVCVCFFPFTFCGCCKSEMKRVGLTLGKMFVLYGEPLFGLVFIMQISRVDIYLIFMLILMLHKRVNGL